MRTWNDLTDTQKAWVLEHEMNGYLTAIIEIGPNIFGNDDLAKRFQKAVDDMERMRTPWFLGERIMEDSELRAWVEYHALSRAEHALYPTPDMDIIEIPANVE